MNAIAKLAIAALVVAGSPFAAIAQDAGASTSTTTSTTTATNPMALGAITNFGSLVTSMQADTAVDFSKFTATSTVNCVKVSTLQGNAAELDTALTANAAKITSLKTSIEGNADLKAKLEAQACPIEDVVAVTSGADGSFTVYIDDRA